MIDPKLNELPADATDESNLTDEQRAARGKRPRPGLSIKDTIAGDTMLSVGGRGVDTSGVVSGAGAGAGMTSVTPTDAGGGSPAPNIVPGAAGTGTTPRGTTGPDEAPTTRLDEESSSITRDEIAERAYRCWHERGCPAGSPEVDWDRAEQELREERRRNASTASAASAGGR